LGVGVYPNRKTKSNTITIEEATPLVDITRDSDPWRLERTHEVYIRPKLTKEEQEYCNFRASKFHIRRLDEIVGQRLDPAFKTRTDILYDAVVLWLENWDLNHPDGATGELHFQFQLEQQQRQRASRNSYLEMVKGELEEAKKDGDLDGLSALASNIIRATQELKHSAPPKYVAELDQLLAETRRLLDPQ
jgi:hypothetical protein